MYVTKAGLAASVALAALLAWSQSAVVLGAEFGTSGGSAEDKAYKRNGTLLFSCCGGTLGALVSDRSNALIHYILSNNHVLALSNRATIGDPVIAPGLIDTSPVCDDLAATQVGTLADFVPIEANGNTVDAAIAEVVPGTMASDGAIAEIGPVNGVFAGDPLGQDVMKRGRTTGLTYGNVALTNVDVEVTYGEECGSKKGFTAVFSNQIYVTGGDFSTGGDSGSLVMTTQPDADGDGAIDSAGVEAVGLLFAGNSGGTFLNPIDDVLDLLQVDLVTGSNPGAFTPPDGGDGGDSGPGGPPDGKGPPGSRGKSGDHAVFGLDLANAVKDIHAPSLLALPGVVAAGVGVDESGEAVIVLHLESAAASPGAPLPRTLEGVRVLTRVTGPAIAY